MEGRLRKDKDTEAGAEQEDRDAGREPEKQGRTEMGVDRDPEREGQRWGGGTETKRKKGTAAQGERHRDLKGRDTDPEEEDRGPESGGQKQAGEEQLEKRSGDKF